MTNKRPTEEEINRGAVALCRFIFSGYCVPRQDMARAVLEAASDDGDDWIDRLPPKYVAQGAANPIWNTVALRETILAVLETMPYEAAPEHLAAQIESQVRGWLDFNAAKNDASA